MRIVRYFRWEVNAALIALVCAGFAWGAARTVTTVHAAKREAGNQCQRAARVLIERKPILIHTIPLSDRCLYLRRLQGEEP